MGMVSIILIVCVAVCAFVGLVVGLVKGFTHVKSWASELALSAVVTIFVGWLVSVNLTSQPSYVAGAITFGTCVACIILFAFLFKLLRRGLNKGIERRRQLSYYRQYDEIENNTEQILQALDSDDKRSYKKYSKRRFKRSGGGWSATDKIFGGITLAVKGAVIAGLILVSVLTVIDLTGFAAAGGALNGSFGTVFSGAAWAFCKKYIFDFITVGILMMCIKCGYDSGISGFVWAIIMIGLVVGSAALSWFFAFKVDVFWEAAKALDGHLAPSLSGISSYIESVGFETVLISQCIIMLGLFLVLIVAVILIGVFVPRLIDKAREGKIFQAVDGAFGAAFATAVVFGILLLVGAAACSMYEVGFMASFNTYFEESRIATYIYDKNIFAETGLIVMKLGSWLT